MFKKVISFFGVFTFLMSCTLLLPIPNVVALNNDLAKTPPMGWNSWNTFYGNINETQIKQIADTFVSSGMKDAGYVYLNLDDNWMANPARDSNGNLRADPTRFPNGIKALADYVHAKGLKLGIYGDRGTMTCMNIPQSGSKGYEDRDAKTFASWGIDYLKYDNCNIPNGSDMKTDYQKMQTALANCGRPIVFSICAWEYQSWMPSTGNLWRTTRDIVDKWDATGHVYGFRGIINLIDDNSKYTNSAGPGAWNDPDMLEVGNKGCTTEEYRTQFSMWSMMASPLIAGNDIRTMSQATKDILLNKEVIAVDQDPAAKQGYRVKSANGLEVWVKPLGTDGTTKAVALLNKNGSTSNITVNWSDIGLTGSATVRDLWAKADKGSFTGSYTTSVPSHGTVMLKVTVAGATNTPTNTPTPIITYGDVSGDGIVDSADYTILRRYLIGKTISMPALNWKVSGDLNNDSVIDSADFTILRKYLLGMIEINSIPTPTPTPTSSPEDKLADGTYKIVNRLSGKALDVPKSSTANGTQLIQWDYSGGNNQRWSISQNSDDTYKIKNVSSGKLVDLNNSSNNENAIIDQWDDNGGDNQKWSILSIDNGYYKILNKVTGKALAVENDSIENNANIIQLTYNGAQNGQWQVVAP